MAGNHVVNKSISLVVLGFSVILYCFTVIIFMLNSLSSFFNEVLIKILCYLRTPSLPKVVILN